MSALQLSFDGRGINGPDKYRTRLATFENDQAATEYGPLFEAAPKLLEACKRLVGIIERHNIVPLEGEKIEGKYLLVVQDARAAIAKAEGKA